MIGLQRRSVIDLCMLGHIYDCLTLCCSLVSCYQELPYLINIKLSPAEIIHEPSTFDTSPLDPPFCILGTYLDLYYHSQLPYQEFQ